MNSAANKILPGATPKRIPMQLKTKSGLALLVLGISIFALWSWWKKTRNFVPVNTAISLASGQTISSEFKLNFDALYRIEIQAQKTLPPDALDCRMGLEASLARCKDTPAALAANWILSSNGQEIRKGSSTDEHGATVEPEMVSRVIGEFQGKAGQEYKLQVTSSRDGSPLAPANPRLKVAVASIAYSDLQSANVLAFSMAFICVLFGLILLAIASYRKCRGTDPPATHNN
jgi:hypothetical protein